MDRISRVDQVLLLIRKQLAAKADKSRPQLQRPTSATSQSLEEVIARRLEKLQAAGLASRSALTRVLLEEILTAQFGRDLVNEARFQKTVTDVQQAIEDDPELSGLIEKLLNSGD